MTYRVVHSWADTEPFGETAMPVPGVVEDDDGIRILLVDSTSVRASYYRRAIKLGAQAILCLNPAERLFVLRSDFAEHREEHDGVQTVDDGLWSMLDDTVDEQPDFLVLRGIRQSRAAMPATGFVNLHNHSEYSALDGFQTMPEMVARALADNQPAVAVTDHGTPAGHPQLQVLARKHGFKPIFGVEAYLVDDRFARDGDATAYWHLSLWATDDASLTRLWAACTEAERDGFYGKPRMDWDTLTRLGEGLLASTGCLGGPVPNPILAGDHELARTNLARLMAIFPDRLYVELHTNTGDDQVKVNRQLVEFAQTHLLPVIAVSDCHYAHPRDKAAHRTWLSVQLHKDLADTTMFEDDGDYHLHTEREARAALAYLGDEVVDAAISETVRLADRCTAEIVPRPSTPTFSRERGQFPTRQHRDAWRLMEALEKAWDDRTRGKPHSQKVYRQRADEEFTLLESKGFCGYVLILMEFISWAKDRGILVGPGRGSGGGSLILYVLSITEIDPVEHDLLFARFLTPGRTALPDVDTDFPSSKKLTMLHHLQDRWGTDRVVQVGTHLRLQNKGAINNTAQAMRDQLPPETYADLSKVSTLIDQAEASSAGLGISWDELWTVHGDELEPYREKYPELFEMAGRLRGRLKSYGRHAAGVVIDPDHSIEDALPLRRGEEQPDGSPGAMVTQFDMEALDALGYVKFDVLTLRTLDTLQMAADLIERDTGFRIDFRTWRGEYRDPEVFGALSDGWTKGVFQIETTTGTRMVKRFGPRNLAELADVITLVRPGPVNSGLTEEYLLRRAGDNPVSYDDPRLEAVLSKTYGLMIYQEDIMAVCMVLAKYDENEADEVRKILGKKQVEKVVVAGKKFISRAVENGTDAGVAFHLWEQMAEFAKYSFNRAHAFAYAVLGYWTGWMKVHYPVQMMCALLSTVDKGDIGDFVEEARRLGIEVLPPDINASGAGFISTATGVRYGLASISNVGPKAVEAVLSARPYTSYADFIERRPTKCNMGHVKLLARVGAFDSLEPNRRGLEAFIEAEEMPGTARCRFVTPDAMQTIVWAPKSKRLTTVDDDSEPTTAWSLPCSYDWLNEPREQGRPNKLGETKPLAAKAPAKKCTRACRRFDPAPPPDPSTVKPYTDGDIGAIEQELLGVRLSTSEFDRIPAEMLDELATAEQVQIGGKGDYTVAALIRSVRKKKDRYERDFAWLSLTLRSGGIDSIIVFSSKYDEYKNYLAYPGLVFAVLRKGDRGLSLVEIDPAY